MDYINYQNNVLTLVEESKKYIPSTPLFFVPFFILKFIGVVIISSSFLSNDPSPINPYKLTKSLTYYGDYSRSNLNVIPISLFSIIIYVLILFNISISIYVSFALPKTKNVNQKISTYTLPKNIKFAIKLNSITFVILVFLSQHIIEILAFPYSLYKTKAKIETNQTVIVVLNSIFIIIINIFVWLFLKINNNPFISSKYFFKHFYSGYSLMLFIFIFNAQAFHYYPIIFPGNTVNVALIVIFDLLLIASFFILIRAYIIFTVYNLTILSCILFTLFISLFNILINYTETQTSVSYYILLYIIVGIIIFVIICIIQEVHKKIITRKAVDNIFTKNKKLNELEYLFYLVEILLKISNKISKINIIYDIIASHQAKCTTDDECNNEYFSLNELYKNLKNNKLSHKKVSQGKKGENYFRLKLFPLIILIENEISNSVSIISHQKQIHSKIKYVLLHCDYIFTFKKSINYSLFLIQEYLSKIKTIPMEYIIYFKTLKEKIISFYQSDVLHERRTINEMNVKFENFLNYYNSLVLLRKYITNSTNDYLHILHMKKILCEQTSTLRSKKKDKNYNRIFESCMKISLNLNNIFRILNENFQNKRLQNEEICYLITNFYTITHKKVPKKIQELASTIEKSTALAKMTSFYSEIKFHHPLIITLSNNSIVYISNKLCSLLKYKENELVDKNFHILFPAVFAEQHNIQMKRSLLFKQTLKLEKDVFIIDKQRYFTNVSILIGSYPSLQNEMLVICNIELKETNDHHYLFITDLYTNLIAMSYNFNFRYQLTYEMFSKLSMNLSDFFGLNEEKIRKDFRESISTISNKNNFVKIDNLVTLFKYCKIESRMKAYSNGKLTFDNITVKATKSKRCIKNSARKMKALIEEMEIENDWGTKMNSLIEMIGDSKDTIEFSFQLHNIGNVGYFMVKVFDKNEHFDFKLSDIRTKLTIKSRQPDFLSSELIRIPQVVTTPAPISPSTYKTNNSTLNNFTSMTKQQLILNTSNNFNISLNSTNQHLRSAHKKNTFTANSKKKAIYAISSIDPSTDYSKNDYIILGFVVVLSVAITCLLIYGIIIKHSLFQLLQDTITINVTLVRIKERILEVSLFILEGCFIVDNIVKASLDNVLLPKKTLRYLIYERSRAMFTDYKSLVSFIIKYSNYELISEMNSIMHAKLEFSSLTTSYEDYNYTSTFSQELHNFHFSGGMLKNNNSFVRCEVKNLFYHKKFIDSASEEEVLIAFIARNVIGKFMNVIGEITIRANEFLNESLNKSKNEVFIYNISYLSIGSCCWLLMIIVIYTYKKKIKAILISFLSSKSGDRAMQIKLENFRLLLEDFTEENCVQFEKEKAAPPKIDNQTTIELSEISIFEINILRNAFVLLIFCTAIHLGLLIFNTAEDTYLFKRISMGKSLSFFYLDRCASFNEVLLLHRVSLLYNNPDYLVFPFEKYEESLSNLGLQSSIEDVKKDERYNGLGLSKMVFLYYKASLEKTGVNNLGEKEKSSVLKKRKQFGDKSSQPSGVCEVLSNYFLNYSSISFEYYDAEYIKVACMSIDGGVSDNGSTGSLYNYFSYLLDEFKDFAQNKKGIDFLSSDLYSTVLYLMIYVYDVSWSFTSKFVVMDLNDLFDGVIFIEIMFEVGMILLYLLYVMVISYFIILSLNRKTRNFGKVVRKLNKNMK